MSRFTMWLPSNSSMDLYPNNAASQFTTKLSEFVELEGACEVGLLETTFPGKVSNVFADKFFYKIRFIGTQEIVCTMNEGIYPSIASVLAELCLLYTSPSPRDRQKSRMPSSA